MEPCPLPHAATNAVTNTPTPAPRHSSKSKANAASAARHNPSRTALPQSRWSAYATMPSTISRRPGWNTENVENNVLSEIATTRPRPTARVTTSGNWPVRCSLVSRGVP